MKYEIKKYPDGGCYARITDTSTDYFKYKINSYEDLFMLRSIKDAWDNLTDGRPLNVHIPCMFQQQHDRRFDTNESFELKLVCEFINSCKFNKVYVYHPHNESAVLMGINNCSILKKTMQDYFSGIIHEISEVSEKPPIILSTDAGSFKWINKLVDSMNGNFDVYAASKMRDQSSGKLVQSIDCKDFDGRPIIVCDDLCVYGGTFVGLAEMLKERNCGNLYLVVSHLTVKNPNIRLEKFYQSVYATNSKFDLSEYDLQNLKVSNLF